MDEMNKCILLKFHESYTSGLKILHGILEMQTSYDKLIM